MTDRQLKTIKGKPKRISLKEDEEEIVEPEDEVPAIKGSTRSGPRYAVWELDEKQSSLGCSHYRLVLQTEKLSEAKAKFAESTTGCVVADRLDHCDILRKERAIQPNSSTSTGSSKSASSSSEKSPRRTRK